MIHREIFEQPLFINQNAFPKPFTPSPELKGGVERFLGGATQLGKSIFEFPGRPVQEKLSSFGVSAPVAFGVGLATDIVTPGPGEIKKVPQIFKGFKDLTTKFLDYTKGKTTLSRQEIQDFAKRPELKKGEADLLNRKVGEFTEPKIPAQEFADSMRRDLLELKPVKVKEPQYRNVTVNSRTAMPVRRGDVPSYTVQNYEEVVFESPIKTDGSSHYPNSKNYFAHARGDEVVESGKKIWREQEIQSDLIQKNRLENMMGVFKGADTPEKALEVLSSNPKSEILRDAYNRQLGILKLKPFENDRFGERIMRERIREKAQKGYAKYRLPTGETIGKIEGFQESIWRFGDVISDKRVKPEDLKIGMLVNQGANDFNKWIVTDILGDGRFQAVSKKYWDDKKFMEQSLEGGGKVKSGVFKSLGDIPESAKEIHDLTGKSNPQYRRYSDWGKFLKNKYRGKEVTDLQGNTWMEIDLKKEQGKMPVEAFGAVPFLMPQREDKNKREIFSESLLINK